MINTNSNVRGYLLAVMLGTVGGGLCVAVVTRAIPQMISKMMSQMMPRMMEGMREQMEECGFSPEQ